MKELSFDDVFDLKQGNHLPINELHDDGSFDVFGANGIVGKYTKYMYELPTVLVTCRGATCGSINLTTPKSWVTGNAIALNPKIEINDKFVYYQLKGSNFYDVISGSAQPQIIVSTLKRKKIKIPDLKTQQEIAHVLEQADKARQQRKAANALTDQFLQSSFLSLFGDPMLNNKTWSTCPLEELFLVKPSLGTTTPVSDGAKYKIVRVGEIGESSINLERCKFVNLSDTDRIRFSLKNGDIVLARAIGSLNHLGKASLIQINDEQLVFDSHVMRIRFDQSKLNPLYFYFLLETKGGRKIFLTASSKTAVQFNINSTQISKMKIPVPPISLQQQFAGIVAQAEQLRQNQRESERELENLFQGLLQKYFG